MRKENITRLEAFEMKVWRRMEKISWTEHISDEVLKLVEEERSLLTIIRTMQTTELDGTYQGRRPRGNGGWSPQNLRCGDGPCIGPPIFREVVLSDARESTNRVKNGSIKEFLSEIVVFLVKKRSYTTFNRVKQRKIRKTWSMTKKQKVVRNKIDIFSGKVSFRSAKNVLVPPNSAPGLRPCHPESPASARSKRLKSWTRAYNIITKVTSTSNACEH